MDKEMEALLAELDAEQALDEEESMEVLGLEMSQLQSQQPMGLGA